MKKIIITMLLVLLPTALLADWKNSNSITTTTNYTYLGNTLSDEKTALLSMVNFTHDSGISATAKINTVNFGDGYKGELGLLLGYSNSIKDYINYNVTYGHWAYSHTSDIYFDDIYTTVSSDKLEIINVTVWNAYSLNNEKNTATSISLDKSFYDYNVKATAGTVYDSHGFYEGQVSFVYQAVTAIAKYIFTRTKENKEDDTFVLSLSYNF